MQRQQRRQRGATPRLVPLSLYPETLSLLDELVLATGESRARVVRRLIEREIDRARAVGIERAPVWIFPSYRASWGKIPARIVYRPWDGAERVFDVDSSRLLPEPPVGSYVLIGEGSEQLRGQVESSQVTTIDNQPSLLVAVRGLAPPAEIEAHPVLLEYVHRLDDEIKSLSSSPITFDPFRTTPSWKLGNAEVRAILVGTPGKPARQVRFLPFSGPSFQDHLHPVSDYFPIVHADDLEASKAAASRIVQFLERDQSTSSESDVDSAYQRFVEAIYILIHAELGGDETQSGAPRRFGIANFGHGMDYKPDGEKGIMQFVVTIVSGPDRGRRWSARYPWRTTAATIVAYDAIRAYKRLLDES